MRYTIRVFLPKNKEIYISDDLAGDIRLEQMYAEFGDVKIEICEKIIGLSLQELEPVVTTTLLEKLQE